MTRHEFRFSGFGGQGVITMAHIVGRAATIHTDLDAAMTEAYGPEKTGGFSRGDVVVSDDAVEYPAVVEPDVVMAFAQDAFERDADSVAADGLVAVEAQLVDPGSFVSDHPDVEILEVPAVELADELGRRVVANIVMLGAVMAVVEHPPVTAVEQAVREVVPDGTESLNEEAFERGLLALDSKAEVIA